MSRRNIVAWDFDGVLNRNIVDGEWLWAVDFENDLGHSLARFQQHIFMDDFASIITGREDLRERVAAWASTVGYLPGPDEILRYWFEKDNLPDAEVVELMDSLSGLGIRQVIATNNEARRAQYIENDMGFGQKVEMVFASGPMGVGKPDAAFFSIIAEALGTNAAAMILVDDREENVQAARRLGWTAFHFSEASRAELEQFLLDNLVYE